MPSRDGRSNGNARRVRAAAAARYAENSAVRLRCDSPTALQLTVVIASGLMSIFCPHAAWNRSTIPTSSPTSASTNTDAAAVTHRSPRRTGANAAPSRQSCDPQRRDRGGRHRMPEVCRRRGPRCRSRSGRSRSENRADRKRHPSIRRDRHIVPIIAICTVPGQIGKAPPPDLRTSTGQPISASSAAAFSKLDQRVWSRATINARCGSPDEDRWPARAVRQPRRRSHALAVGRGAPVRRSPRRKSASLQSARAMTRAADRCSLKYGRSIRHRRSGRSTFPVVRRRPSERECRSCPAAGAAISNTVFSTMSSAILAPASTVLPSR